MFNLTPFNSRRNDLFNIFDDVNRSFLDPFTREFTSFRTDISDKGDHYLLEADLPGFTKEDIDIEVRDNQLIIRAEHNEDKEEKTHNYIRRERSYGSFVRSFDISNVISDSIKADYRNGVLKLQLPKKDNKPTKGRKIDIN